VRDWARAFDAQKEQERLGRKSSRKRAASGQPQHSTSGNRSSSLYARAKAKVNGAEPKG
jgi:hypothetical protein